MDTLPPPPQVWRPYSQLQDISLKTKQILAHLGTLADDQGSKITLEHLKKQNFPPATENFLFHLAAAEQILLV